MKQGLWLAGIASVAVGLWSSLAGVPGPAQEPDCANFWIPPGSNQPQCLESLQPTPSTTPESTDSEAAAPDTAPPSATEEPAPEAATEPDAVEPEWTLVAQREDGLQFLLDTASVAVDESDPDVRAFIFRQDASQVSNPAAFDFLTRDQAVIAGCSQASFSYGDAIVRAPNGEVFEFTSDAQGIASEEADPGFFAALQAACALDLATDAEAEMPAETPAPTE